MGLRSHTLKIEMKKHTDLIVGERVITVVRDKLNDYIELLVKVAEKRAREEHRKTMLPRDIEYAYTVLGGMIIDDHRRVIQK